ncbi:hypothetical protein FGB62_258g08 [Gracilaria domingensis]|nr:hypothetical protein FGB62_258g08 [Gracilaria domingensis]
MTLFEGVQERVDLVTTVGASALPSPARRCQLQFNPFLDPDRPRTFQVIVYNNNGKFQRVAMEGSSNNFPSQFLFRNNASIATSGESAWELNSSPSLSSDAHYTMGSASRTCSMVPGQDGVSNSENAMESCSIPKSGEKKQPKKAKGELSPVNVLDSNVWIQDMTNSIGDREIDASPGSPRSVVSTDKSHASKKKTDRGVKRCGTDAQRPRSTVGSGTLRSENVDNDASPAAHGTNKTGGDKERNLSKKGSLRKLLSRGRSGGDDAPSWKNSLRNMLRKTSRTLLGNVLDGAKPTDVDAEDERQAVRKGRRATEPEERGQKAVRTTSSDKEFEKLIMKHALHVEKCLDDLVSP